ncbi:hypothetical protein ACER0A_011715 [Haloimpatiens sp. FM7315]|uniref:hypothetical protein n=1 Tax=Haloimpatiens sp. FM7315 TaxID=3298609 RepID=UPI00370A2669
MILNIVLLKKDITQYVSKGYEYSEVIKQLLPRQLIPDICKYIFIYGGVSLCLFGIGHINKLNFQQLKKADNKAIGYENQKEESDEEKNIYEEKEGVDIEDEKMVDIYHKDNIEINNKVCTKN